MPKPPRKPAPPKRDATADALFEAAEMALDEHFSDPDNQESYETWLRKVTRVRGKAPPAPKALESWDLEDDGRLDLSATPVPNRFSARFVHPEFRGLGIGKALLRHVAAIAIEKGCKRLQWAVLDWNTPAIDFYRAMGAEFMDEWRNVRVSGEALMRLAGAEAAQQ